MADKACSIFLFLILALTSTMVLAAEEREDGLGFEAIVSELSQTKTPYRPAQSKDPFADVMIHGGLGFVTSYLNLTPQGNDQTVFLKGVEAYFGIDLFSRHWVAEGGMRSFSDEKIKSTAKASLKEFDLKVIYKPRLNRFLTLRMGLGLAARYLSYTAVGAPEQKFTTPSTVFVGGIEAKISPAFSIGTELAYHSAMIEDTIDASSVDGSVRLNIHF